MAAVVVVVSFALAVVAGGGLAGVGRHAAEGPTGRCSMGWTRRSTRRPQRSWRPWNATPHVYGKISL